MILKGNSRGGAKDLALHLMKQENEHVEVHELRGFASANLMGALNEAYAVSRGTRCKQFLYSLSLSPPPSEKVGTADFEAAIERIEEKLGLSGQPRAIVFHEKEGPGGIRRHAHAVWSRIDSDEMKAVQMSYDHKKLNTISRELFIEHGWKMPEGLANSESRDPKNFTLAEWQQAKRIGKDPRAIKTAIQDAWAISDSKAAFIHALEERGYKLARGDRRGFVAVDVHGEAYSIAKQAGLKTKLVKKRLGDEKALPSVGEVKAQIAHDLLQTLDRFKDELDIQSQMHSDKFEQRRKILVAGQRAERRSLKHKQDARHAEDSRFRQARFRKGFKGLWDHLRGAHKSIALQNKREAQEAIERVAKEKDQLVFQHLQQRRQLGLFRMKTHRQYVRNLRGVKQDTQTYREIALPHPTKDEAKTIKQSRRRGPTPEP